MYAVASSERPWCAQQVAFPESTCIRPLCNSPAHSVCTLFGLLDKLSVTLSTTTRTSRRSTGWILVMVELVVIAPPSSYLKNSDALRTFTLQNLLMAAKSFQFSVTTVALQRRALVAMRASRARR